MPYKTILVHVNDERRAQVLLDVACDLARRSSAHLIGLCLVPPLVVAPVVEVPYGGDLIDAQRRAAREEAERIRALFERAVRGQTFLGEWRFLDCTTGSVAEAVLEQARSVDLVVAPQHDPAWGMSPILDVGERLALESGRPVLLVPNFGTHRVLGRRVVIAWNGRREAARATFDALPLLIEADSVKVLWINPQDEREDPGDAPTADICQTLARHGVRAEAAHSVSAGLTIGDELLSRTADEAADLIVMGCYGHSRLREFVFGGATRHLLRHMTVPVLMSH